jgi:hypothetical protein
MITGITRSDGSKYLNLTIKVSGTGSVTLDDIYFGTVPLNIDDSIFMKAASPAAIEAPPQGNVTKQAAPEKSSTENITENPKEEAPGIWAALFDFIRKLFGSR